MQETDFIVVGAGVAGLRAAIALAVRNADDRDRSPSSEARDQLIGIQLPDRARSHNEVPRSSDQTLDAPAGGAEQSFPDEHVVRRLQLNADSFHGTLMINDRARDR